MSIRWSPAILNQYVAPGIAEFTEAVIPEISEEFPQAQYWLANHFLNTILRAQFKHGARQIVLGYLRRAWNAFDAYHRSRIQTLEYLQQGDPATGRVSQYYAVVTAWETFVLQVGMVFDLYKGLCIVFNAGSDLVFSKGDGSKEERIYTIANQIKHVRSCVKSGQCTELDTVPLWLTRVGLHSFDVAVSFEEAAQILSDIATIADSLQDPLGDGAKP